MHVWSTQTFVGFAKPGIAFTTVHGNVRTSETCVMPCPSCRTRLSSQKARFAMGGCLDRLTSLSSGSLFLTLTDTTGVFTKVTTNQLQFIDLFLDGSCVHPTEPDLRIASGLLLSSTAQTKARPCRLWFDNESVQQMIAHWIQGFEPFWQEKQDADLWFLLHAQFQHARPFVHASMKVQAHAKPPLQETVLDEWAVWGNGMADLFAEEARQQLSLDFWNTWTACENASVKHLEFWSSSS